MHAADSPDTGPRDAEQARKIQPAETTSYRAAQLEELSVATVVVGITVEEGDCEQYCESAVSARCTTTRDRTSADWILVRAAEFESIYRALGCAENAG